MNGALVGVVTDSAANVPPHLVRELGIEVVPMYLNLDGTAYRDGIDIAPGDFYRRLGSLREPATTSSPSPGDFLDAFDRTGHRQIVCVTVAAEMSSTHRQALRAAEAFDGTATVIDSGSASMGQGFPAVEAARHARSGAGLEGVAARCREVLARIGLYATVDSFEFLRRSGRVNALQAYVATALDIKPVFRFVRGRAEPVARSRTRRRAVHRVVVECVQQAGARPVHVAAFHADAEQAAHEVVRSVREECQVVEATVVEATPVIGAHTGPGLVGAALYCD